MPGLKLNNTRTRPGRMMLIAAAFAGGLGLFLGTVFAVTGLTPGKVASAAAIGGPFKLVDQNGKPFTAADMAGKPYLVFFGYTHCPDVCPTTLFEMSQLFHTLGPKADRLGALFITVDPQRDTAAVMKEYLASFDPHLRGLTGGPKAIDVAIKDYRVYAKKVPEAGGDYSMDHSAIVYLMDKDGHFVAPFDMQRPLAAQAAALSQYL